MCIITGLKLNSMKKKVINLNLETPEAKDRDQNCPLSEYPRKQFERESYLCLHGAWDYLISKDKNCRDFVGKILVPYPLESSASLVQKSLKKGEYLIYRRTFNLNCNFIKDKVLLNLFGIDQEFEIIINNNQFNKKTNIGIPHALDITSSIKEGENEIIIICYDDLKPHIPHGKQVRQSKGMFYTSVSGIYFPIFLESVSNDYIKDVRTSVTMDEVSFEIKSNAKEFNVQILENDKIIKEIITSDKKITYKFDNPHLWDVDDPFLYDVIIKTENDKIRTYFGLREVKLDNEGHVLLNNRRVFLNGVLDQGYYPEGIFTPSTYKSYENDILTMKKLGLNMIRKHIKVETEYFYYLCDKLGMLVMQDYVCNSKYHYIYETVLPTIGFQTFKDLRASPSFLDRAYFIRHGFQLQDLLYNHPSIIAYTIFNEGWGQFKADKVYDMMKKRDSSRLYDSTSGWFRQNKSDFESYHIYFADINKKVQKSKKTIFLSEFGGYVYKDNEHSFNLTDTYGYKLFKTQQEFEDAFVQLYEEHIIPNKDKICGTVYTQVSDVEDETNGFMTYDRKILKVNPDRIRKVMDKLIK